MTKPNELRPNGTPHANVLRLLEEHGPANLAELDREIGELKRRLTKIEGERSRLQSILSMNRVHEEMDATTVQPDAVPATVPSGE